MVRRADFDQDTKQLLARRAGFHCSNPGCRRLTSGPNENPQKVVNIGVAAHITAAAPNGPRFDPEMSMEERRSAQNGIWLCQTCARLVDEDAGRYPAAELQDWKSGAEAWARQQLETGGSPPQGGPASQEITTGGGAAILGSVRTAGGDFIGRDQVNNYQIAVHVLQAAAGEAAVDLSRARPYFPDRAFRTNEAPLFTGRDQEIDSLLRQLHDDQKRAAVIYGRPEVGKTSLLTAGMIPKMVGEDTLVIHLRDYAHPLGLVRAALLGRIAMLEQEPDEDASLSTLLNQVYQASGERSVLVLDQFERYLLQDGDREERQALRSALEEALANTTAAVFKLVFSVRQDMQANLDREWVGLLPDLRLEPIYLQALDEDQARAAIETPLDKLKYPASIPDDQVVPRLLSELKSLSPENALDPAEQNLISPANLQIVCYKLYEAARGRKPPHYITTQLYLEVSGGKGAEQILGAHFDALLARIDPEQRPLARTIAQEMLDPEMPAWVSAADLQIEDASGEQIAAALEEMARAGLLVWHFSAARRAYTFASNTIKGAAWRALGEPARRRHRARNELVYVWNSWVDSPSENPAWATRRQLNMLAAAGFIKPLPAERSVLLLRSAVERHASLAPWLAQLQDGAAQALLKEIEKPAQSAPPNKEIEKQLHDLRLLLGVNAAEPPLRPDVPTFGALTWTAAVHKDPFTREAAALALWTVYGSGALALFQAAAEQSRLVDNARLAELRGVLAEVDSSVRDALREKGFSERLAVWGWRFRRRVVRDWSYVGTLALGGALGAGFGVGLLRALLAPLIDEASGFYFYSYAPSGFALGLGLALGLLLVNPLRLANLEYGPGTARSRPAGLAIFMGTLGFGLANLLLVATMRPGTFVDAPFVAWMAPVAGLGLSLALFDQPMHWRSSLGRWLVRLLAAAAGFTLTQGAFILAGPAYGESLVIGWSGGFLSNRLRDNLNRWNLQGLLALDRVYDYTALLDSALVGISMTLGCALGLYLAYRYFVRWQELKQRAGE